MRTAFWERDLAGYIAESERKALRYGIFDCCIFAAGAIRAMCVTDPLTEYRGYHGLTSARKLLKQLGGLEQAVNKVAAVYGFAEVHPLLAHRGDLVLADVGGKRRIPAVGILGLDGWNVLFAKRIGLCRIPLIDCRRAWRIE
jgi:hypothetical protein